MRSFTSRMCFFTGQPPETLRVVGECSHSVRAAGALAQTVGRPVRLTPEQPGHGSAMRCLLAIGAALLLLTACGPQPVVRSADGAPQTPLASGPLTATFANDTPGGPPAGFTVHTVGPGHPSHWIVFELAGEPTNVKVLKQVDDDDTNGRYPCVLSTAGRFADVRVEVDGKGISGNRDRSFGVIARAIDEKNYFVARCNTVNENVRLYRFVNGVRKELAEWEGDAKPGVWHHLALEIRGDKLTVFFNGKQILTHVDNTFPAPGRVGMWTKAESVSEFMDFKATPLP